MAAIGHFLLCIRVWEETFPCLPPPWTPSHPPATRPHGVCSKRSHDTARPLQRKVPERQRELPGSAGAQTTPRTHRHVKVGLRQPSAVCAARLWPAAARSSIGPESVRLTLKFSSASRETDAGESVRRVAGREKPGGCRLTCPSRDAPHPAVTAWICFQRVREECGTDRDGEGQGAVRSARAGGHA